MGNQVVQENRKRWSRAALILSTALALSAFLGWQTRLAAHDNDAKQKYLEEATKSPDRGNNAIPGAINLGLTSRRRSGSFAGAYLNKALKSRSYNSGSYGGNYQTSGKKHFGSDPREDVKLLAAAEGETVRPGASCPANVPKRVFNISAINVEITLNQYHDFYPGVMYVLDENIEKVRAEEKRNEEARENEHDPGALTQGLSGDAIQPLAIRVNQGECLVLKVSNKVEEEKVSFHLHGSSLLIQDSGKPAVAKNPESYIEEEKSQTYEWYVGLDQQEGVHQFHSHVRDQASTGLFGTVTVEPKGSRFLDPYSGKELKSGWLAMIEDPNGPDFREFVVVYHETGDEEFRPLKKNEEMIPLLDETAHNYRSSTRALNYRSEAFGNNLLLEKKLFGQLDESLAYSAYKNGDTVTPIPRSYLGDPAKWRLVHGGSEVFHSHHLHGGAIRWRRQAKLKQDLNLFGTNNFALASDGPVKFPPVRSASDRVDVQTIGPAETHDLVIECGTGGCQRGAGDFLYHCHIPQHYVAGMWAYWRSYNTLQVKGLSTDVMPPLAELPDRKGKMKPAVSSDRLIGRTVRQFGKNYKISVRGGDSKKGEYSLTNWVESQLPPKGLPGKKADPKEQTLANDASVWNWDKKKMSGGRMLYLGEPETKVKWPKYKPEWMGSKPGKRPKLMFDPATGRLAYPHMRPHFGRRPPFSPGHNGAPFLEPFHERADGSKSTDVPVPGENGPWSLCPAESDSPAQRKHYNVHAITTPITLAKEEGKLLPIVDKDGQIYVLHEEEEEIRANDDLKIPLVLRANVGDCVDVTLTNEIPDYEENLYSSKVNMHIHFVQFDTQASDGVITGMSYEQSVRPFTMLEADGKGMGKPQNEPITEAVKAGATQITLRSTDPYQVGVMVGVGMDAVGKLDIARITAIKGNTLVL
ncbi:MAG: multicopper oxidase domain-containing protein, partial [Rhodospirillales bacterium]|nr:multicopper oxidase domain-containing protein [Rhodospirillales bacterium]